MTLLYLVWHAKLLQALPELFSKSQVAIIISNLCIKLLFSR